MPISNLLTLRETATALKMHRHTLRKHMRAGMPHLRAPGARKVQFVLAECLAWLSASAAKQAAVAERESVRGRMRRLVAPGPKPLTRKEQRAALKASRNAENRAMRKPATPEVAP